MLQLHVLRILRNSAIHFVQYLKNIGDDAMPNMTPSPVTEGQVGKILELVSAAVRKSTLRSEPLQQVLEHKGIQLTNDLLAVFQKHVDANSDMIVRTVTPDRSKSPQEVIDATRRKPFINDDALATMPKGHGGGPVDVHFFPGNRFMSDEELKKEYEKRGLIPDPYAQAKVNEEDSSFTDDYPNASQWKVDDGEYVCVIFRRWRSRRFVFVGRYGGGWVGVWWFGGVRKHLDH